MSTKEEFKALFEEALAETKADLRVDLEELSAYASQRLEHLATLVGQPGYDQAVRAERDAVLLRAGIRATREADAADQRLIGILQGAMRIGAAALAASA